MGKLSPRIPREHNKYHGYTVRGTPHCPLNFGGFIYLDPPFGCQISSPRRSVFSGFLGLKFQTQTEDSGRFLPSSEHEEDDGCFQMIFV